MTVCYGSINIYISLYVSIDYVRNVRNCYQVLKSKLALVMCKLFNF